MLHDYELVTTRRYATTRIYSKKYGDDPITQSEPKMSYMKLASTEEVPAGTMKAIQINGRKILLANMNGKFFALDDRCPHIGKPLSKGTLHDGCVTCPYHGAEFDLQSGENVKDANFLFWKLHCDDAKTYDIQLIDQDIFVSL